jgi:isoleucyl-tRNA synthetase
VPRLLDLIDELTNWYIRINRRRLKGESGPEDTKHALNSLFETLLTLCRTLTSFTPFFTENIYQTLKTFFPEDRSHLDMGSDLRSVHFLPFPQPKQEYYDPVVERQVKRMQAVIVLGRVLRDRHNIPVKVSL